MNTPLADHLDSQIRSQGPLSFHLFMEQALFHQEHGFYASGQTRTGRKGDFLTPVSPGPVLGELLARQADELHVALGRPERIRLIEQGADAGWLARDLLAAIHREHPELAQASELHLIEPHPRLAEKQKETLGEAAKRTRWHPSWETIPGDGIPSFFYSCELVDSFPARIFRFRGGTWREQRVDRGPSGLVWQEAEIDAATWAGIRQWNPPEMEGFTMELRPGTPAWVKGWTEKISTGLAFTLDYGFPASELLSPGRSAGTLVALRGHQRVADPLADPGQLDLTTHVNFTELEELAAREGWRHYGLTNFSRGLTALAANLLKDEAQLPEAWIRNFRHLTHPNFFGHTHKILVQGKSLPESFHPAVLEKI